MPTPAESHPGRRMTARSGSFLLLTIAIVTTLMLIAFAFVRMTTLHHESNDNRNRALLAREAARYGLNHAIEELLRDHINDPVTRLDGSGRAQFIAFSEPFFVDGNNPDNVADRWTLNRDDVPLEDSLWNTCSSGWGTFTAGLYKNEGRGRFREPEFAHAAVVGFDPTRTQPTVPIRFTERVPLTGAPPADPARSSGLFYDRNLRRLTGGSAWTNRSQARYRLRYAIVASDLDGQLLATGDPALDYRLITSADPSDTTAYPTADRNAVAASRVVRSMHQIGQMAMPISLYGVRDGNYSIHIGQAGSGRLEHVFANRGATPNIDISPANRAPVAFPLMFRSGTLQAYQNATAQYGSGTSVAGGTPIPSAGSLYRCLVGPQFSIKGFNEAIIGYETEDSGFAGNMVCYDTLTPFGRGLASDRTGDLRAPAAADFAVNGRYHHGRWRGPVDTPWSVNVMTAPVRVVNAMIAGYMPPGAVCAYFQKPPPQPPPPPPPPPAPPPLSDWPESITATVGWQRDFFVKEMSPAFATRTAPGLNYAAPARAMPALAPDYKAQADNRPWYRRYPGPIVYNGNPDNLVSGGVPRLSDDLGTYLRAITRPVAVGTLVTRTGRPEVIRSNSGGTWRYKDTAGARISIQHGPNEEYTGGGFWMSIQANSSKMVAGASAITGSGWNQSTNYAIGDLSNYGGIVYRALAANLNQRPDLYPAVWIVVWRGVMNGDHFGEIRGHPDSIWETLGAAMEAAISVARGTYLQYQSKTFDPATGSKYFDGHDWQGPVPWAASGRDTTAWDTVGWGPIPRITSIRDVDALFVANLGSNWNDPVNPTPVVCWKQNRTAGLTDYVASFTPTYNLAGLRTATTSIRVVATTTPVLPKVTALAVALVPDEVDLGAPQAPVNNYQFPIMAWNHPNEPRCSQNTTTAFAHTDPAYLRPSDSGDYTPANYSVNSPYPSYSAEQRTAICELIINDMRLSLFGSNPGYRDRRSDGSVYFHPLDLNGDGVAHCSGFVSSNVASEIALNLDCYAPAPAGYANREVDNYFSHTGTFMVGKSRFWRITVRGEVWDNVLDTTINKAQLDAVLAIDPMNEAREWDDILPGDPDLPDPARLYSTHIIYQRWIFDPYRGFMPRVAP